MGKLRGRQRILYGICDPDIVDENVAVALYADVREATVKGEFELGKLRGMI